ncbi:hypothetical protein GHT07_14335 [Caenimonas koreensis DSM 17982]|uniref:Uncharacterized protein n=1 Tax=Caenimonas koreensis DSM 17982 TaxID=1121255 RepID=A0A844B5J0_9BURK|nr:hypothetical protein [Caenimonas koreensis]MRD48462.1 hypothetical protein [Caenimonas koreensis DSM 17982]
MQIPEARSAVEKMLQYSPEIIAFLNWCDAYANEVQLDSLRPQDRATRDGAVPPAYRLLLLMRSFFTPGSEKEINMKEEAVASLLELSSTVQPFDKISWSSPISIAVRNMRNRVVTTLVLPQIEVSTGRKTHDAITAAVERHNAALRPADGPASDAASGEARARLMRALRTRSKPAD